MQTPSIVLIIDDDPTALEALKALLEPEGYQLECASNGQDGLSRAIELQPDVIMLDIMLPGMDGYELCRRLRSQPQLEEVPIVIITALDDQPSRIQGIEAGADDFITKPYNKAELQARVHTITRLNRHRRLATERERFSWILQQTQEGYLIVNEDDIVTFANPRAHLYLGFSSGDGLLGHKFSVEVKLKFHLYPDEAWECWPDLIDIPRYLVEPETPTAQAYWLRVDQLPSSDIHSFGRLIKICDVTEQITTQKDMRAFHEVIEHKLRTPLGHIKISLDILQSRIAKHKFDDLSNLIQNASDGARILGNEMNDVFQYISASALAQPGEGFHLMQFRSRIASLCADLEIGHVNLVIPPLLLVKCLTITQSAMDLILWEVLENAKKFHPQQNPKVDVIVSSHNDHNITVKIQDDGITLSPKQLLWAWLPYIQGEKYLTGQEQGMGLGLPLVYTLVWQIGGHIRLMNRDEQAGVVVEITLPLTNMD